MSKKKKRMWAGVGDGGIRTGRKDGARETKTKETCHNEICKKRQKHKYNQCWF